MINIKQTCSSWWLLITIPLVAVIFLVPAWYLRQAFVDSDLREQVTSLKQAGDPFDLTSLLMHVRETTSDENTVAWLEWMGVALEVRQASFSAGVLESKNNEWSVANPSSDKPTIEKLLLDKLVTQSKPAYQRLKELTNKNQRVWLPGVIAPQGMDWVVYLFMLPQIMQAVSEGDADGALEALATYGAALNALDWQTSILVEAQLTGMLQQRDKIIMETIEQGLFSAEQLDRLNQIVGQQPDIRERWRNVIAAERAVFLERVRDHTGQAIRSLSPRRVVRSSEESIPASYVQHQLASLSRAMDAADEGIDELQQRAAAARFGLDTISQREMADGISRAWSEELQNIAPNFEEFARSLVRREASRNATIEAIDRNRAAVLPQREKQ